MNIAISPSASGRMSSHRNLIMSLIRSPVRIENNEAAFSICFSHGVAASNFTSSAVRKFFLTSSHSISSMKSLRFSFSNRSLYASFSKARKVDQYPAAELRVIVSFGWRSCLAVSRYSRNLLHNSMVTSPNEHFPLTNLSKWRYTIIHLS